MGRKLLFIRGNDTGMAFNLYGNQFRSLFAKDSSDLKWNKTTEKAALLAVEEIEARVRALVKVSSELANEYQDITVLSRQDLLAAAEKFARIYRGVRELRREYQSLGKVPPFENEAPGTIAQLKQENFLPPKTLADLAREVGPIEVEHTQFIGVHEYTLKAGGKDVLTVKFFSAEEPRHLIVEGLEISDPRAAENRRSEAIQKSPSLPASDFRFFVDSIASIAKRQGFESVYTEGPNNYLVYKLYERIGLRPELEETVNLIKDLDVLRGVVRKINESGAFPKGLEMAAVEDFVVTLGSEFDPEIEYQAFRQIKDAYRRSLTQGEEATRYKLKRTQNPDTGLDVALLAEDPSGEIFLYLVNHQVESEPRLLYWRELLDNGELWMKLQL